MLLCVCLNPAVDVTYRLRSSLVPGSSHRVATVAERPGGKGVNVARVLRRLGAAQDEVLLLAPVGGVNGQAVRTGLATGGIESGPVQTELVEVAGATRRTVTVVDEHGATVLNEPGPELDAEEWSCLTGVFERNLADSELVVLSGSLPPGLPADSYRILTELAGERGVRVVLDAEGAGLLGALGARPYLIKPNRDELASTVGRGLETLADVLEAGRHLLALGARNAVVSLGADGLIALTEDGTWLAAGPEPVTGNPTGAGDALVAALALGTVRDRPWPSRLRSGIAVSAAAVAAPVAGAIDRMTLARIEPGVTVTALRDPDRGPH